LKSNKKGTLKSSGKVTKGTAESFFDMTVALEEEAKAKGKATGCLVTPFFEYHIMVVTKDAKPVGASSVG
jgi:hypothetical protein